MKKLLSVVIAMVLAMSFLTGCVDRNNSESNVEPTPSPTPAVTPSSDPVNEEDPNYPTVLAMWKDMDGYWANDDGEYMFFTLNADGKAILYEYDEGGKLERFMVTTAVMSSNKTSYYMAFDIPAISGDEAYPGLVQAAGSHGYMIELGGYGDGYVEIADEGKTDADYDIFVKVGSNLDKLKDAVKTAEKMEKDN